MARADRKGRKRTSTYVRVDTETSGGSLKLSAKIICLLFVVLCSGVSFVWLQSSRQELAQSVQSEQERLKVLTKQMNNLRMELAHLKSGEYIMRQVQHFDLDLQPAASGQVRQARMPGGDNDASPSASGLMAANMWKRQASSR